VLGARWISSKHKFEGICVREPGYGGQESRDVAVFGEASEVEQAVRGLWTQWGGIVAIYIDAGSDLVDTGTGYILKDCVVAGCACNDHGVCFAGNA
jgi:hypothetical protein